MTWFEAVYIAALAYALGLVIGITVSRPLRKWWKHWRAALREIIRRA